MRKPRVHQTEADHLLRPEDLGDLTSKALALGILLAILDFCSERMKAGNADHIRSVRCLWSLGD